MNTLDENSFLARHPNLAVMLGNMFGLFLNLCATIAAANLLVIGALSFNATIISAMVIPLVLTALNVLTITIKACVETFSSKEEAPALST